jgi:PAS domain S-box-containing protein
LQRLPPKGWYTISFRPSFWLILVLLVLITILQYREVIQYPSFLSNLLANIRLDRYTFERILYLIPVIWAGFVFGWRGAFTTSIIALGCMLPRAIFISPNPRDAIIEITSVFIVGNMAVIGFAALGRQHEQRVYLSALNYISGVVSQSLELKQILNSSIDSIVDVMNVDVVLIFLLDDQANELILSASRGVSSSFVSGVDRMELGEGLNSMVVRTGEPMFIKNTSKDPRLTKIEVKEEGIQSQIIAPLKSKGKVVGTICLAMRRQRRFNKDEVSLLAAIGNQIGVAIENARLYQEEHEVAEQLRASEERYRTLFQNAHDAIWVHDMDGNIVSTNAAVARLTGYEAKELCQMNVRSFLSEESLNLAKDIRTKLLSGEPVIEPYEQKLTTKGGVEAIVKLTTNLVESDGKPVGFQNIARDVSREKIMQDSLRFYLSQITMAQEEERKRIARELHDDTIQSLVVLARELDDIISVSGDWSFDKKRLLENLHKQTNDIMAEVRRMSQDLRPPTLDRLGLISALESLATSMRKHSGMNIDVAVSGESRRFSPEIELVLFRVAQEALSNAVKHSQASNTQIAVEFVNKAIRVTIKDNGCGFYLPEATGDLVKQGRLGLAGMQERIQLVGGSLRIESEPGDGTTVVIEAPI